MAPTLHTQAASIPPAMPVRRKPRVLLADSTLAVSPAPQDPLPPSPPPGAPPQKPAAKLSPLAAPPPDVPSSRHPWQAALDFLRVPRKDASPPAARSPLLGAEDSPSVFPSDGRNAGGLLAPAAAPRPRSPWALQSWKKFTLDVYVRLVERPRESRLRVKQTVALLPFLKLKPVLDLSASPWWRAPARAHLDVKALGCVVARVRPDGGVTLRVRARAPLRDPRFALDVLYSRDLRAGVDDVRLTFRALDVAFLKGPGRVGGGCKIPVHFARGVKSTLRVKKFVLDHAAQPKRARPAGTGRARREPREPRPVARGWFGPFVEPADARDGGPGRPRHGAAPGQELLRRFGVYGPAGLDVKLRLWEFGNEDAEGGEAVTGTK